MRRALSLIAFGATLFTASAELSLGTIRAVDTSASDKDSWSVKGATIDDSVTFADLQTLVVEAGIVAELINDGILLDAVTFTADDCKFLSKERGVVCKIKGANLSVKLFTSTTRTKGADPETTTSWKVAGSARRREFEEDLVADGGLTLSVAGLEAEAFDCSEKTLAHGQTRLTCVPVVVEE